MLRRVRIGFALLAFLLALPLALLLTRTLQGLADERDARHRAVSSRVFDEAERALLEFVEGEELRSPRDYEVARAGGDSPLAALPEWSFVTGYFVALRNGSVQGLGPSANAVDWRRLEDGLRATLDPTPEADGGITETSTTARGERASGAAPSRFVPRPELTAEEQPPLPATEASLERNTPSSEATRALAARSSADSSEPKRREPIRAEATPAEASSAEASPPLSDARRSSASRAKRELPPALQEKSSKPPPPLDSYEVLEQLNLGKNRARQQSRTAPGPLADERAALESLGDASAESEGLAESRPQSGRAPAPERPAPGSPRARLELEESPESEASDDDGSTPRSELYWASAGRVPFEALRLNDERLALHRRVSGRAVDLERMGLVVDLGLLGAWIQGRVIRASGLEDYLELAFEASSAGADERVARLGIGRQYVYAHRFQPPFDSLTATLSVAPLPEGAATYSIYAMAALLCLVATAGLFAMYKMVATVIHFSERRSNFAAAVSHELKTPLTSIRMYAEMLRDGMVPDTQKRQEYLSVITAESERLSRLIQNVLTFSRLERSHERPELTAASLHSSVRAAIAAIEPHARSNGFELALDVPDDLPQVWLEQDALEQILFNLVDNAVKYAARADDRRIEFQARPTPAGVELRVRDHGPGVPPEHLARIFEPFYRAENELTRTTRGTGIGLALVESLCERIGAEVSAHDPAEGGLEVCVRLRPVGAPS